MTITPHLLTGAALATTTSSPIVAFLLGFISHFILDAIPHVDPGTFHNIKLPGVKKEIHLETVHQEFKPWPTWIYIFAASEFIFIWLLVIILFAGKPNFGIIMMGGLGGIFVDIIDNPIVRFHLKWPVFRQIDYLHHKLHYDLPAEKWYWGIPIQIIIIGVSLWFLLR